MKTLSGSFMLSTLAWISVFAEMWMMLIGHIKGGGMSWSFLAFFLLTAIFSGSLAMKK